ncbi:hypothetical protein [Sphingopyxis indica]|uniref:Uncharacterized protein n=1 Tax=Sphingopyxis indica TaxID=436663 RepID=A0A239KNE0_9SPHN|nr:hypothetical protein [Sphingopyxis indica]SNT19188.1 hypothetical protein SAMN06295955_11538 [Sphingopyxis indica]
MPRIWPDPRDDKPESPWWPWFVGAVIAAMMLGNLLNGLSGRGWNW